MATIPIPKDFREFLQFVHARKVEYLLIGGWAVMYHGYPRTTGDMDIWIALNEISGVEFAECYARRLVAEWYGVPVSIISREDLKANKLASGRLKDLNDLQNLS